VQGAPATVPGHTTGGSCHVNIDFYGVRGSTPCACESNRRYGGNTACVVLELPGTEPIVFDLGTGLRLYGEALDHSASGAVEPFAGHALVTHLHWDHVQGLPFFAPLLRPGSRLDIWGPAPVGRTLRQAFDEFMGPPWFPVGVDDLPGTIEFHDLDEGTFTIGDVEVRAVAVPHIGDTYGYRVRLPGGPEVVYLPDHQQPLDGSLEVAPEVIELCRGADVLIHDAQFTPEEFADKAHWGHCTVEYAVTVAAAARVRRLVLFHHDPAHDDDALDEQLAFARALPAAGELDEVLAAHEGLTIHLGQGALPSAGSPVA
jgi:phosphoribosyl 1,2-cyclic phosphodiesterase